MQVSENGAVIQTNTYDATGRRIKKITPTRTINYIAGLIETDGSGSIITAYKGVCFTQGGINYYPVYDNRGSVIKIVDGSGNVTAEYTYDNYGVITSNSNTAFDNRFFFCGCEYDAETGLYLMGARFYDPEVGRFITPDPIGAAGGLNIYAYCHNDPINYSDPCGLDALAFVGVHLVAFGNYHTSIIIIVDSNSKFYNDPQFLTFGNPKLNLKYITIGAGPTTTIGLFLPGKDRLVNGINRPKDMILDNKVELLFLKLFNPSNNICDKHINKDNTIDKLLELNDNYQKYNELLDFPLDYDLWPSPNNDGYNSNSFVHGLLLSSGIMNIPTPTFSVPGWNKPVSESMFLP
jgi:RHS repeat-associated protein